MIRKQRTERPADVEHGKANLRPIRFIQAKCAFPDSWMRIAFELNGKTFVQRTGVGREILKSLGAERGAIDQPE